MHFLAVYCPLHSGECDISVTSWGNFFSFGLHFIHLDSRINWLDFGNQKVKDQGHSNLESCNFKATKISPWCLEWISWNLVQTGGSRAKDKTPNLVKVNHIWHIYPLRRMSWFCFGDHRSKIKSPGQCKEKKSHKTQHSWLNFTQMATVSWF